MFSCTKSALIHAFKKGHLATWPGLTEDAINKYLKLTPATTMRHMNQPQASGEKTHYVFAVVIGQGQIYTDSTGSFPARSIKGINVLIVCYSYDANYIRPIAMKSKSGA
jgi:hypothetical protein